MRKTYRQTTPCQNTPALKWCANNGKTSTACGTTLSNPSATPARQVHGRAKSSYPLPSTPPSLASWKFSARTKRLWYRRNITIPDAWAGNRVLLHFQASDWETSVYINGENAGQHRGGYDPFTFDITDHLTDGANELIVSCWDATEQHPQALGKQIMPENRQGFRYQPTGGIWQTVWLEAVPEQSIRTLRLTPDIDAEKIDITVSGERLENCQIQTIAYDGNEQVSEATGQADHTISLPIPNPKLWHPDHPFLYDLKVRVQHNGETIDTIDSYFGMRKIAIGEDENGIKRFLLNDKPIFQLGPLDQGYWPDGIPHPRHLTKPSSSTSST